VKDQNGFWRDLDPITLEEITSGDGDSYRKGVAY